MIKQKRRSVADTNEQIPAKKIKKVASFKSTKHEIKDKIEVNTTKQVGVKKTASPKSTKFRLEDNKIKGNIPNESKIQKIVGHAKFSNKVSSSQEKTNWVDFKKQKKELKLKRKQSKDYFDVVVEAKVVAEKLRQKQLEGGTLKRKELVSQLHNLLGGKELYKKLVLTHDMARVVQYLLKFGSENIRNSIAKELIPLAVEMLMSKYGRYCFKNMLKYGNSETRIHALRNLYGNAVKLSSHVVSAAIFEYAYSTWATQQQKCHFIQEFFGDMYKLSKDNDVKHLCDVYKDNDSLRIAALNATKSNLGRVFNKNLFDSGLVQSVLFQYMCACMPNDKKELISQLDQHAVVLSNSRDGARVVMQCIWHGSTKEKKTIVKAVKENLLDLAKHEFGHWVIITLLDAVDDTVLLNKSLVSQIVVHATDLVTNEWGRKVLLWLVVPGDKVHFHPTFVNELHIGQQKSTCRKETTIRRDEICSHCSAELLKHVATDALFWLSTASIAFVTLALLKSGVEVTGALQSIVQVILHPEWKIKTHEKAVDEAVLGIEHSGLHMILKKLAQHDKVATGPKFGKILISNIEDKTIHGWLLLNRGCFLLVAIYESSNEEVQQELKEKVLKHKKLLKKQSTTGAKILLEKIG